MPRQFAPLRLHSLEARLAPATWVDTKTLSFQDVDGDAVTVAFSKPVLTDTNANDVFKFATGVVDQDNSAPQQLQTIDLTAFANGIGVTVSAAAANGGDGKVNVGWVNGTGKDLASVSIAGDLGRLTAGDAKSKTPGLLSLAVDSIGSQGINTQATGGSLASVVVGAIKSLSVTNSVLGASLQVTGGASGSIGAISIGGSLSADATLDDTGLIDATGSIGPVAIGGYIMGGAGADSGIRAGFAIGPVTIGGSLQGDGPGSAAVIAGTRIGPISITGSLVGGTGFRSAAIIANHGSIGPVLIGGDLSGGGGDESASIQSVIYNSPKGAVLGGRIARIDIAGKVNGFNATGSGTGSATIIAFGAGPITVSGDVTGGIGDQSAAIEMQAGLGAVKIKSLTGGVGSHSGSILSGSIVSVSVEGDVTGKVGPASGAILASTLGPITIAGNLIGGDGDGSAEINAGRIASITIAGDVNGGIGADSAGIDAPTSLGTVKVNGPTGLTGGVGPRSASISGGRIRSIFVTGKVAGNIGASSASISATSAIGLVSITGSVTGGAGLGSADITAGKSLGRIAVVGDWVAASIAAGFSAGPDGYFNTADDIQNFKNGSIAGITIGGTVDGTAAAGDTFAFLAASVKSLKVGGNAVVLKPKARNDDHPLGTTGDFQIVEK